MATEAAAFLGAGKVRLDTYNPDTLAWSGLGDELGADKFEITGDSDVKEKTSKGRSDYGQSIASVVIGKPTKIAITISQASRDALAMQFQGVLSGYTQGSATVADEAVTAKLGKWVKLANRNLANGVTVKNDAGTTTYVAGDDYEVNFASGEIRALASGAIAEAQALKVGYTANAIDGQRIRGGVRPQVRARAVFTGVNLVDNKPVEVEAYEAVLRSSSGFDFLADDFAGIELEGSLVVPAGKTEPYTVTFL